MNGRRKNRLTLVALVVLATVPLALTLLLTGRRADVVAGTEADGAQAPVFRGFEDCRYQRHDRLLATCVADYNARRGVWAGATSAQAEMLPELTVAQVKAQMIQESGGRDVRSAAAWAKDPLQANVPGDWSPYKRHVGLRKPRHRNDGTLEGNVRAGIALLVRKGFGASAQPAANRPGGVFDDWRTALARYNGRMDRAADGQPYCLAYADRILARAKTPGDPVPIRIERAKRPAAEKAPTGAPKKGWRKTKTRKLSR